MIRLPNCLDSQQEKGKAGGQQEDDALVESLLEMVIELEYVLTHLPLDFNFQQVEAEQEKGSFHPACQHGELLDLTFL